MKSLSALATCSLLALAGCATGSTLPTPTAVVNSVATQVATATASAQALNTNVSASLQKIGSFTVADLKAADADAVAHNDAVAHACYPALEQFVGGLPSSTASTTVTGAFVAFQRARDLEQAYQQGIPAYLKLGCAPLLVDTQTFLAKLAALAGVTSAVAPILPAIAPALAP